MSVQIPGTPTVIGMGDRANISPVSDGSSSNWRAASNHNGFDSATRVSLSTTARLADSFAGRLAGITAQSALLRTQSALTAAHASLQSEARLLSRTA